MVLHQLLCLTQAGLSCRSKKAAAAVLQNMSAEAGTSFVSVQRVPTTTLALKQAITNQPVVVGVDASDWSDYYNVTLYSFLIRHSTIHIHMHDLWAPLMPSIDGSLLCCSCHACP